MKPDDTSPGWWTHLALWLVVAIAGYKLLTPEVSPPFGHGEERNFRIAAFPRAKSADAPPFVVVRLAQLAPGGPDLRDYTFLAPADTQRLPGGDLNEVRVVERGADFQIIEFVFVNSHSSVSRYRATRDRVDPMTYRQTLNVLIPAALLILMLPASLLAWLVNRVWRARRAG